MTRSILFAIFSLAAGAWLAQAQNPPIALQITSPSTGTVVHPGDQITVSVNTIPIGFLPPAQQVFLAGEGMGVSGVHSAPFQFTFQIPPATSLGEHNLYAAGQSAGVPGISAISNPITLQVVPTEAPWQIVVEPAALSLQLYPGSAPSASAQRLHLYFQYPDGTLAPVSPIAGPNTFQITDSTGVISVDNTGLVTPKAAGFDQIQISCFSCGVSSGPPIPVVVQQIPIYVAQQSIMESAAGGNVKVSVITNGMSYSVAGESWARDVNSASTDQIHWTTTVVVDRNQTPNPRIGTLRLSLATGETQDVVIYQAGSK
jgi:hypothetical protein